jgi:A/G-specific adenine glycosylase
VRSRRISSTARGCAAAAAGDPERFPRPRARAPRSELRVAFAWIETRAGVWLERRPLGGLWGGLWELPAASGPRSRNALAARLGVGLRDAGVQVRHDLTHRRVKATVLDPAGPVRIRRTDVLRPRADPLGAPLSALARKAIEAYASRRG